MTKTINLYCIAWDNGHASGIFPSVFTSKKQAERFGKEWKSGMVAVEDPEDRKEAKEAYSWEVVQCPFYVERNFEWPGNSWSVYTEPKAPRASILTECPYRLVVPATVTWLENELKQPTSDYLRNKSVTL